MKQSFHSVTERTRTSGAALVITLAILILVTALVLSMFTSVTSERSETAASANQSDSKRLANMAVELVKSTITQATTEFASGNHTAWASQPGMIRTWTNAGVANNTYRLYSSGAIVTTSTTVLTDDATALAAWRTGTSSSYNALWCDLNAPALSSTGALVYPIVTPPISLDPTYGVPVDTLGTLSNDGTANGVQGFTISSPGYSISGTSSPTNNPAPMPVKWLYVLQNGEFVSPTASGSNASVPDATASNPIVARVAYWTDDESCKVNINTASEGVFWQYPHSAGSWFPTPVSSLTFATSGSLFSSVQLACFQPGRNEFQRYPGHPATVSLSSVLQSGSNPLTLDQIYSLVPRIQQGGSVSGTQIPTSANTIDLSKDVDRLYVSPNELIYSGSLSVGGLTRSTNNPLTADDISKRSFFLTASSRAPETTLFETPRVSIWPTMTSTANQDPFDKLLNFCGTLNNSAYYFQRQDATSPTNDYTNILRNKQLYQYLQQMTASPIPGFGGDFKTKYPGTGNGLDRDQILTEIFDYIRSGPNLMGAGFAVTASTSITSATSMTSHSYSFAANQFNNQAGNTVAPIQIGSTRGFGNGVSFIQQAGIAFYCEGMNLTGSNGIQAGGTTSIAFGGTNSKISYTVRAAPMIQLFRPTMTWDALCMGPYNLATTSTASNCLWVRISTDSATITPLGTGSITAGNTSISFPQTDPIPLGCTQNGPIYSPIHFFNTDANPIKDERKTKGGASFCSSNQVTFTYDNPQLTSTTWVFNVDPTKFDITAWPAGTTGTSVNIPNAAAAYDTSNVITTTTGTTQLSMAFSGMTMTIELLAQDATTVLQTATVRLPSGQYPVPHWNFNVGNSISNPNNFKSALIYTTGASINPPTLGVSGTITQAENNFNWVKNNFLHRLLPDASGTANWPGQNVYVYYDPTAYVGVDGDVVLTQELNSSPTYQSDLRLTSIRGLTSSDMQTPAKGFRQPYKHFYALPGIGGSRLRDLTKGQIIANYVTPPGSNPRASEEFWSPLSTTTPTTGVMMDANGGGGAGDWDNGFLASTDGPLVNYPDTGIEPSGTNSQPYVLQQGSGIGPAVSASTMAINFSTFYSPNRQMYSPFQFGSLPSRVWAGDPWETLLFCPNPAATRSLHRGYNQTPKDYLLGDLFWMPIVDPYPISEPLSTAGKINLNYAIAPFNYIQRKTALWALLKASRITAFDNNSPYTYKVYWPIPDPKATYVHPINVDQTLQEMDAYTQLNGMFKSATEIAEIFLVPADGTTYKNTRTWWNNYPNTGDNTREQPYAYLLPRLTTKSNTYTVHYRVQTLKKMKNDPNQNQWVEGRDSVVSEFRGSATIERYIDPNDTTIPDFATQPATALTTGSNLANFYRWRTVQQKQFVP